MSRLLLALALLTPAVAAAAEPIDVTTSDGVRLRVDVDGPKTGEAVLLLHGFAADTIMNWRLPGVVRALVDAGFRVIAPDQRGHGRSEAAKDGAYGRRMVTDAVEVLDALHVEKAHVVGYSMGGMIGLRMAADHPERVRSLLMGGMGWIEEGTSFGEFAEHGPVLAACGAQLGELGVKADALSKIDVPVSVVVGELDPNRTIVDRLHEARPRWPVEVVPGAGHLDCVLTKELRAAIVAHCTLYSAH